MYFTVNETAKILSLTPEEVINYCEVRVLKKLKEKEAQGRYLVLEDSVLQFIFQEIRRCNASLRFMQKNRKVIEQSCRKNQEAELLEHYDQIENETLASRAAMKEGLILIKNRRKQMNDDFAKLEAVYRSAVEQASCGKGAERHGNGKPFHEQPICEGCREFGIGAALFQAWKKTAETMRLLVMPNGKQRALREMYGAMNYLAAACVVLEEKKDNEKKEDAI